MKNQKIPEQEIQKQIEYSELVKTILSSRFSNDAPRAFVHTYGCQGNVADGERLKGMLEEMGYELTEEKAEADFILLNTCAIREHAEDRVFGNVGALKSLKAEKKTLKIFLCGCMMQQEHVAKRIEKSFSFVDTVFGTHAIHRLPEFIYKSLSMGKRQFEIAQSEGTIAENLPVHRDSSFKAWLPIMFGCNNFCSYCVVPYVRGRERSREPEAVIEEAKKLVSQGYKDITLLGQNVNSYNGGKSGTYNFPKLLRELNKIEGEFLIRFMTSHPKDCTPELLETMAACEKVANHLHLPFQSGNNRVLKEMNRGYTREKYLSLLKKAYELIPELSVTSDVIVGFPGETRAEFEETLSLINEAKFTSLFTFIFSPRKGTKAAEMRDEISRDEKVKWFQELCSAQDELAAKRTQKMQGQTFRVLCESVSENGTASGRTQGNVVIEFPADKSVIGTFQNVEITNITTWMLSGKLSDSQ